MASTLKHESAGRRGSTSLKDTATTERGGVSNKQFGGGGSLKTTKKDYLRRVATLTAPIRSMFYQRTGHDVGVYGTRSSNPGSWNVPRAVRDPKTGAFTVVWPASGGKRTGPRDLDPIKIKKFKRANVKIGPDYQHSRDSRSTMGASVNVLEGPKVQQRAGFQSQEGLFGIKKPSSGLARRKTRLV